MDLASAEESESRFSAYVEGLESVIGHKVDFLSPKGVTWGVVGKSVEKQGTVANIGRLFRAAKAAAALLLSHRQGLAV